MGLFGGLFGGGKGGSFNQAFAGMALPQQQAAQRPSFLERLTEGLSGAGAALRDDPGVYEGYQNNRTQLQALRQRALIEQQQADIRRQQELQDYQTRRGDQNSDWMAHQEWERKNPKPSDDAFTRALEAAGIKPGTPEYQQMARQRAQMLTQPVQLVPDGMGGMTAVRPNVMDAPQALGSELPQGWTIDGGGAPTAQTPFGQAFPGYPTR